MKLINPFVVSVVLLLVSFGYFLFRIANLVWFDFIVLFLFIGITYYLYKKDKINIDYAKIFLAITLFLMADGSSELFLRFILNLLIFYAITVFILSLVQTKKSEKIKALKDVEYAKTSFLILCLFLVIMIVLKLLPFSLDDPFVALFIVLALLLILDYAKKVADPYINNMKKDDLYTFSILLFCFLYLFDGGFEFIFGFILLLLIKTAINATKNINKISKHKIGDNWSIYNYTIFSLIFTLLTNKSVIEIILWSFA